ncbi:hypothetical protein FB451DRAFT_1455854 [Mycena latifolia]|nr:hypothetical protein FB451DRAFT_1455854 [Mycena latifolia]
MTVAAALLGIVAAAHCAPTLLPLIDFDCPYRTPFSTVLWRLRQLWHRICGLMNIRPGRSREHVVDTADETMVEVMINRATEPSAERDQRDQRALCWTMKSLVDGTVEPFINGIPDMLWGPDGRKYKHDRLIRTLLDDPDVRLGDRLLDLMRYSDSGLFKTDVELRCKVSCLKALWSIGTLSDSEKDALLNLPLHGLARQLAAWPHYKSTFLELGHYLFPTRAVLAGASFVPLRSSSKT